MRIYGEWQYKFDVIVVVDYMSRLYKIDSVRRFNQNHSNNYSRVICGSFIDNYFITIYAKFMRNE